MNIEKRFCISFIFILSGTLTFSETYDVSWSGILDRTVNQIKSGNEKIINPVLILFSLLTIIKISSVIIKYMSNVPLDSLIPEFIRILVNFSMYSYIIKNSISIIDMFLKIFTGIGEYFSDNSSTTTLDSIWEKAVSTTAYMFKVINDWALYLKTIEGQASALADIPKFMENFSKAILLSINSSKVYIVNEETKGFETQNIDESEIVLARGNEITFKKIELSRTHIVIEAEIGKVK